MSTVDYDDFREQIAEHINNITAKTTEEYKQAARLLYTLTETFDNHSQMETELARNLLQSITYKPASKDLDVAYTAAVFYRDNIKPRNPKEIDNLIGRAEEIFYARELS